MHIHFKIRSAPTTRPGFEFVSQLYFPDSLTDRVHALPLYSEHTGRRVRNENDPIFGRGGERLLLAPTPRGTGYAATFDIALQET